MGLFRQENNFKIQIEPEILQIPEFKALVSRDKSPGKEKAHEDLSLVYLIADYKSPYSLQIKQERIEQLGQSLKNKKGWKPDKVLQKAISKYEELQVTPSMSSLISIKNSLTTSTKLIEKLQSRVMSLLEGADGEEIGVADLAEASTTVTTLLTLAGKLPIAIKNLEDLEEKVKKEQVNESKIRGGGSRGMFED